MHKKYLLQFRNICFQVFILFYFTALLFSFLTANNSLINLDEDIEVLGTSIYLHTASNKISQYENALNNFIESAKEKTSAINFKVVEQTAAGPQDLKAE